MKWTEGKRGYTFGESEDYYVTIVQQRIDQRYLVTVEVYDNDFHRFVVYEGFVADTLESAKEETLRRLGLQ